MQVITFRQRRKALSNNIAKGKMEFGEILHASRIAFSLLLKQITKLDCLIRGNQPNRNIFTLAVLRPPACTFLQG